MRPRPDRRPSRLALPLWVARTTLAARRTLREERIDCVVSTGGRPSVPVGLAARSLGVPLFLLVYSLLVLAWTTVVHGLLKLAGGLAGLALFLPFYIAGGMGAGDVKAMAACMTESENTLEDGSH